MAQLYAHVFVEEHVRHRLGTERGVPLVGHLGGELRVIAAEAGPEPGLAAKVRPASMSSGLVGSVKSV